MKIINLILALVLACAVHEGGHYVAARFFGKKLKFRFKWAWLWKVPVPRLVWAMPLFFVPENWKQRVIALAGFQAEFFFTLIFWLVARNFGAWYLCVVGWHFILYRFYAGEDSDFKWVI